MRLSHSQNPLVLGCSELPLPEEANIATSLTESFTLRLLACDIDGSPALATARSEFQTGCHACCRDTRTNKLRPKPKRPVQGQTGCPTTRRVAG
jgi:hypothetical protein